MRAIAAGVTDVGKERDHNEDRFVLLPEFDVFVVADGMGGHQCGEVASRMATSTIASFFRAMRLGGGTSNGGIADVLRASLLEANERIHKRALHSPLHRGMGTTVVAAAFSKPDERVYIAHAGDSRCYRMRDGELVRLTRDHSLLEEALRTRPDITRSELAYLPANVITRALGVESAVEIELTTEPVRDGDLYLLCSDGLHGFVPDERIREILLAQGILTETCLELVKEANSRGGGDNITVVLVRIETLDDPWAVPTSVPPPPKARASSGPPAAGAVDVDGAAGYGDDDTERMARLALAQPRLPGVPRAAEAADDTDRAAAVTDADAVLERARARPAKAPDEAPDDDDEGGG
jgi:protein phosphatase